MIGAGWRSLPEENGRLPIRFFREKGRSCCTSGKGTASGKEPASEKGIRLEKSTVAGKGKRSQKGTSCYTIVDTDRQMV